jgi:adenine-specific DNA-methyltransferase
MRPREDVTPDKLRGGFYTPPRLVDACLERVAALLAGRQGLRLLEPSAGDGAFLRGIGRCAALGPVEDVRAVEVVPAEAAKAWMSLRAAGLPGHVVAESAVAWAATTGEHFDAVVGNPPFVRYQFVSACDKKAIAALGERLGIAFAGVSNLWIPVLLGALSRLRPGGALAVVVPTECFTGVSASVAREWLGREVEDLRFDLFPPGSFPGVLQEVAVLSGRRAAAAAGGAAVTVVEHDHAGGARAWGGPVAGGAPNWMELLLEPSGREALEEAATLPGFAPLASLARLEVSIVTGANDFFCVADETLRAYELAPWARPLLPRSRHAPGLWLRAEDHDALRRAGARAWLLDFGPDRPDPMSEAGARRYLALGEDRRLHTRYKCRIRTPWYRVPSIRSGALLLSKRSHRHPRLILNEAGSLTTDTIYRGALLPSAGPITERDLVSAFHSSLTLLTAELHGRSFGGGVLELVPSELARVAVAVAPSFGDHLGVLDRAARSEDPEALVEATDALLVANGIVPRHLVEPLVRARRALLDRRLDRNRLDRLATAEAA